MTWAIDSPKKYSRTGMISMLTPGVPARGFHEGQLLPADVPIQPVGHERPSGFQKLRVILGKAELVFFVEALESLNDIPDVLRILG